MAESRLSQLETAVDELSVSDQFRLVERLVQRIRARSADRSTFSDDEIERMAHDPAILEELKKIETEFAQAAHVGLPREKPMGMIGEPMTERLDLRGVLPQT